MYTRANRLQQDIDPKKPKGKEPIWKIFRNNKDTEKSYLPDLKVVGALGEYSISKGFSVDFYPYDMTKKQFIDFIGNQMIRKGFIDMNTRAVNIDFSLMAHAVGSYRIYSVNMLLECASNGLITPLRIDIMPYQFS